MSPTSTAWASSPLLELLLEEPGAARCLVAPDGTVLRANAEWLRMTGLPLQAVVGAALAAAFADDRCAALAVDARAGGRREVPRHARSLAGRDTWWEGTLAPVPLEGGTGLLVTYREVSEATEPRPVALEVLARLRSVADHAPVAVFVRGGDGRYLFVNRWLRELLGLRSADAAALAPDLLPEPAPRPAGRPGGAAAEAASEETIRTPRGERVLMTVRFPFPIGDGTVGTFGVGVDVTERRRAEAAQRESEERFRLLADTMPQIVCVLGTDGAPEYVNPGWTAFSGLDLAATARGGWPAILHPDDLGAARECLRRVLKGLAPQDVELRYRAADGSYRWFLSRLAPVVEGRRVVRLVGAALDIEARRRAEVALRENEERYRTLFTSMTEGFALGEAICDARGVPRDFRFLEMNDAFEVQSGLRRAAVAGRPMREVLPQLEQSWVDTYCGVAMGAPPRRFESYNRDLDRHFSVYCFSPGAGRFAIIFTDVTDRMRAERAVREANEQLREADRRKDEFLGMLSHELRNPLAPIRNALYILDRVEPGGQQARRAKEIASRQVAHLTRLVDDLLDVTRIARGKIELRRADVDVGALARRAAEDHRVLMQDRGVDLRVEVPSEPLVVNGDETRLAQVLGNLLSNAAKFTPAGGRVTLAVAAEGPSAVVHVRDTGPGIEPGILHTIFEPFTQGKQTLARSEGGLGLGLALVRGLVALHGGEVIAASGGAGLGSDFVVTLPLVAPRAPPAGAGGRGPGSAGRRLRVLVVDDNRDAAETLAQLVAMLGHDTEVAFDGAGALALAEEHPPDVVLCDLGLPTMDGYELARRLRAGPARAARLLAVSGYAQPEDVARALGAGFDGHVAKPADPEQLARLLE